MAAPSHFAECFAHSKGKRYIGVKDMHGEHKVYGYCDQAGQLHKLTDPKHPSKGGYALLHELKGWTEGCMDVPTTPQVPVDANPPAPEKAEFSTSTETIKTESTPAKKLR